MNISATNHDRIRALEREMEDLRQQLLQREFPGRTPNPIRVRPAKTWTASPGTYPSAPCTVYPIVFTDLTFTETIGNQTITHGKQAAEYMDVAAYYGTEFLESNTDVLVVEQRNGKLVIVPAVASEAAADQRAFVQWDDTYTLNGTFLAITMDSGDNPQLESGDHGVSHSGSTGAFTLTTGWYYEVSGVIRLYGDEGGTLGEVYIEGRPADQGLLYAYLAPMRGAADDPITSLDFALPTQILECTSGNEKILFGVFGPDRGDVDASGGTLDSRARICFRKYMAIPP